MRGRPADGACGAALDGAGDAALCSLLRELRCGASSILLRELERDRARSASAGAATTCTWPTPESDLVLHPRDIGNDNAMPRAEFGFALQDLVCNFAAALRQNENKESSCYRFDHEDGEYVIGHDDIRCRWCETVRDCEEEWPDTLCFSDKHTVSLLVRCITPLVR